MSSNQQEQNCEIIFRQDLRPTDTVLPLQSKELLAIVGKGTPVELQPVAIIAREYGVAHDGEARGVGVVRDVEGVGSVKEDDVDVMKIVEAEYESFRKFGGFGKVRDGGGVEDRSSRSEGVLPFAAFGKSGAVAGCREVAGQGGRDDVRLPEIFPFATQFRGEVEGALGSAAGEDAMPTKSKVSRSATPAKGKGKAKEGRAPELETEMELEVEDETGVKATTGRGGRERLLNRNVVLSLDQDLEQDLLVQRRETQREKVQKRGERIRRSKRQGREGM